MHRRVMTLAVSLISLMILGAWATWTLAQQNPPDGTFVRAADGTVYAVSSGAKIRLAPLADSGNILALLRDGPSAASVDELNAAMAAVAPTPVISNPAQTLIGQSARVCAEVGFPFQQDIVDAQWQKTVAGRDATGNAMWAVVFVNMTNLTNNDLAAYRGATPAFYLADERGRRFDGDLGRFFDQQHQLAADNGFAAYEAQLKPGVTEERVIAFEVAPDAQRLTMTSVAQCG